METHKYFIHSNTWVSETFKHCNFRLEEDSAGYHIRKIRRKEDRENYTEADVIHSKHYCRSEYDLVDVMKIYRIITSEESYFESLSE